MLFLYIKRSKHHLGKSKFELLKDRCIEIFIFEWKKMRQNLNKCQERHIVTYFFNELGVKNTIEIFRNHPKVALF